VLRWQGHALANGPKRVQADPGGRVPLLDRTVDLLRRHGITDIVMAAGQCGEELIRRHYAAADDIGSSSKALGTARALRSVRSCVG
jgi:NDP-sugar pyrophosphorylase family protein